MLDKNSLTFIFMGLKSFLAYPIAVLVRGIVYSIHQKGDLSQHALLKKMVKTAQNTQFGKDHQFYQIENYEDFKQQIPVRDYEQAKSYFDEIIAGKENITWPKKPIYFAKTSGTTSGAKYIPITKDSINHHIAAARNALLMYIAETKKADFFDKKMIFLQGSPELENVNGIPTGRLSGIVYHHVPKWLLSNRMPSYETNCIEDWETKLDKIVDETLSEDMSVISGIPPWCIMYFEKLIERTGKKSIHEIFPNFKLFVYGGLNYEPYREKIQSLIGYNIPTIETYPASEGFFAYQFSQKDSGLLLNLEGGILYEFIEVKNLSQPNPKRCLIDEVKIGVNYVLIVSTNAGLWAYNTGDTVKFVSLKPYKIIVTGRIKHYLSAFGEHVIAEEVESVISKVSKEMNISIIEFTVTPNIAQNDEEKSCHEWLIEIENADIDLPSFKSKVDDLLQEKNIYYKDLREGNILDSPKITLLQKNTFKKFQVLNGKLGGQNKVQHLSNDRNIANQLLSMIVR